MSIYDWPAFAIEVGSTTLHAEQFAELQRHKSVLISILRKEYNRGPKSNPFDEENTWGGLTRAAYWFFDRPKTKRKMLSPARRRERLRDLEKALRDASKLVRQAMQDQVGIDLLRGWCDEANIVRARAELLHLIVGDVERAATSLEALKAAALRAAKGIPVKRGPQKGSGILTAGDKGALETVYRRSTGLDPIIDSKPFANFVQEFLVAVGHSDATGKDYAFEALKHLQSRL